MATILPTGEQQFIDENGAPFAAGKVYFYIPTTSTPKDTWKNAGQTILNTNPVILDVAGRAIIYGQGQYRMVLEDSLGNVIYDQLTLSTEGPVYGGLTSAGSANVQTLTPSAPLLAYAAGQTFIFKAGFSNSGALTLNVSGLGAVPVLLTSASGPIALTGGEVVADNILAVIYDGANFQIINAVINLGSVTSTITMVGAAINEAKATVASAATTNIGAAAGNYVNITGSVTITAFDVVQAGTRRILEFSGSPIITSSASILTPGSKNLAMTPGACMEVVSEGAGVWRIVNRMDALGNGAIQGGFKNLKIIVASDSTVTVTADAVALGYANANPLTALAINATLSSASTGLNGLDTGSVAPNTWYAVYVVTDGTTVGGMLSTSSTAPTVGVYLHFARVGWVLTDAASKFMRTLQLGRRVQYVVGAGTPTAALPIVASGSTGSISVPTWTSVVVTGVVPVTASQIRLSAASQAGGNWVVIVAPNNAYGASTSATNAPYGGGGPFTGNGLAAPFDMLLETTTIYWANNGVSQLRCHGWEDNI